jgi:hypothetical protein
MTLTEKTRVLFVDDEPLVLGGLQRMLRRLSNDGQSFPDRLFGLGQLAARP